jgi:hypothetical protein
VPDTDEVISVSSEQGLTIGTPRKGDTLNRQSLLATGEEFRLEFINTDLGLEIPDLDGGGSSSTQPVSDG